MSFSPVSSRQGGADFFTNRIFSFVGMTDNNQDGVISRPYTIWGHKIWGEDSYQAEADLDRNGEIAPIEAHYYLQSCQRPAITAAMRDEFKMTDADRQVLIDLLLRAASARHVEFLVAQHKKDQGGMLEGLREIDRLLGETQELAQQQKDDQAKAVELRRVATAYGEMLGTLKSTRIVANLFMRQAVEAAAEIEDKRKMIAAVCDASVDMAKIGMPREEIAQNIDWMWQVAMEMDDLNKVMQSAAQAGLVAEAAKQARYIGDPHSLSLVARELTRTQLAGEEVGELVNQLFQEAVEIVDAYDDKKEQVMDYCQIAIDLALAGRSAEEISAVLVKAGNLTHELFLDDKEDICWKQLQHTVDTIYPLLRDDDHRLIVFDY